VASARSRKRPASPDSLTLTIPQAAAAIGISTTLAYEQARENGWLAPAVIKIGTRVLISRKRLEALVDKAA
jgi:hypothetical protein